MNAARYMYSVFVIHYRQCEAPQHLACYTRDMADSAWFTISIFTAPWKTIIVLQQIWMSFQMTSFNLYDVIIIDTINIVHFVQIST